MRRPPTLTIVLAVLLGGGLTACTDDGYDAPDREISFADIVDADGAPDGFLFDDVRYRDAYRGVAEVTGSDPSDPGWLLDDDGASRYVSSLIVACAWSGAIAAGDDARFGDLDSLEGFDDLREELLAGTDGGEPCLQLDEQALARFQRDVYTPPRTLAEWVLITEAERVRGAIATALAPEIAEAVAG